MAQTRNAFFLFLLLATGLKPLPASAVEPESSTPTFNKDQFVSGGNQDVLIEITDRGIENPDLEMRVRQGVVFFLNNTSESLITLEIDFGKNALACYSSATPNLQFGENGKLISTRPIPPGSFASTCLPSRGTYPFTVYGLKRDGVGTRGMISVSY